jgi:putative transposase
VLPSEQDRPDIARKRAFWKRYQDQIDPRRLVFIDETWTKTNMAPLRGWAPRGQRLETKVPYGHWKTLERFRF